MDNFPNCVEQDKLDAQEREYLEFVKSAPYHCDICGNGIWHGDTVFYMSTGERVCDELDCLIEWAETYKEKAL